MQWCGASPNWAAGIRIHVEGTITSIAIELKSFLKARAKREDGVMTVPALDEITREVSGWDQQAVSDLLQRGMTVRVLTMKPLSICYIPSGWITAEKSSEGRLFYGCRKGYLLHTSKTAESYKYAQMVFEQSGKAFSTKMKEKPRCHPFPPPPKSSLPMLFKRKIINLRPCLSDRAGGLSFLGSWGGVG